nr:uncharacterized protein LOC100176074 isoform X1 [Ciona intestinalis]|eukprot:XP_002130149.1 uncharacterized protein LOC100176074 isoform X1 [Ciona intestinalis]
MNSEKIEQVLFRDQIISSAIAPKGSDAATNIRGTALPSRKAKKVVPSKFESRLADAALRQAAEGGYLISPSRSFLLERCQTAKTPNQSLRDIEYIHLSHFHIRTLGHIQSCRHLRVCILNNNYLTRFNALENCPHLVRLDLHSNQITKLPDEGFWREMKSLQILNLHDNGIGKLDDIQSLCVCVNLVALTLYDTPLSLKTNYRHHTVNSIWSLKALDHHVIGDDEIIEDALFSKRFMTMNPRLWVDLCPKQTEPLDERTIESEMKVVKKILFDVNRILVHGSPVVVIQRWVRGHICRKALNISYDQVQERLRKLNFVVQETPSGSQVDEVNLDYDTYLKNRRPGSKTPSAATTLRNETPMTKQQNKENQDEKDDFSLKLLPSSLHINLNKLEQNAMRSFDNTGEDNVTIHIHKESILPTKSLFSKPLTVTFVENEEKEATEKPAKQLAAPVSTPTSAPYKVGRRDTVTVQQMLGPSSNLVHPMLKETHPTLGTLVENRDMRHTSMDPDVTNHEWRVHDKAFKVAGGKPVYSELEPTQDHLMMNREAGRDVREAVDYWHEQEFTKPTVKVKKPKPVQRLVDHVSLATLAAVSNAYRDRDKSDHLALKVERVMRVQQEKMQARNIVAAFKEEKRSNALHQRQTDRIKIAEGLQQNDLHKQSYIEYAQERKERALQRHRAVHSQLMFASDFGNQHTSVSNALIRHDRQAAVEDTKVEKTDIVNGVKLQLTEQAELVRRYMEHKQLMRQMAGAQDKSKFDAQALQEANDRILAARQRVAGIKARKAAVQAYQHSLPTTSNPGTWPLILSHNLDVNPSSVQDSLPEIKDMKRGPMPTPRTAVETDRNNSHADENNIEFPPVAHFNSNHLVPQNSSLHQELSLQS